MSEQRPGLLQRLRLAARVYRDGMPARYTKKNPIRWPDFRVGTPQWQIVNLEGYIEEGFNANALIYSAVMYKARAISGVPLRAYTGEQDEPETLPDDNPLAMLCARPNPSQSWREFMMLQTVFLNISGNAYSYIDRQGGTGDVPAQIIPLNPMRTYIVPGERGTIKGFLYVPENVALQDGIPLLAQDVSHVKLPNPGDPLDGQGYGLSPISSMARSADVDNSITKFLKTFFDRGTNVGGILEFDVPMTDADISRVRTRWQEIYGGVDNWDQVGVLDQTGEYKRIGYSFDEMGFETLDERNETRILGPFGVPPILIGSRVGLARSTYSNYEQARDSFWQDTAIHEMRLFEDDFQYHLSSGDAWVAFDFSDVPAFQNDLPPIVDAWVKLVNLGVPKAQAAEVVGLPLGELEDGDVAYMPLGLVPLQEAAEARQANREALAEGRQNSGNDERGKDKSMARKYDPDQPRDEIGRWTDAGGNIPPSITGRLRSDILSAQRLLSSEFPEIYEIPVVLSKNLGTATAEHDNFTGEIRLNEYWTNHPDEFYSTIEAEKIFYRNDFESTMVHEYQHALKGLIVRGDSDIRDEYFDAVDELRNSTKPVSAYAEKNGSEWQAERFTYEIYTRNDMRLTALMRKALDARKASKSLDVKKNSRTRTSASSGKHSTQLVGTMSAGSRLARKAQWKKTVEKSSAD